MTILFAAGVTVAAIALGAWALVTTWRRQRELRAVEAERDAAVATRDQLLAIVQDLDGLEVGGRCPACGGRVTVGVSLGGLSQEVH